MGGARGPQRVREVSRRLRARADGIVSELWFMPESQRGYADLGVSGPAGTFGGRIGALGPVPGAAAAALLVPLNPAAVVPAVDAAWAVTTPDRLLATRERVATGYLRAVLGDTPEGVERAAELARRAADAGPDSGHPLAAAHRTRGWTGDALVDVWRASERIRERRHESHRNAWTAAGLDPCELCVLTDEWRGPVISSVSSSWTAADQEDARERLAARGLVDGDGITGPGRALRERIEDATDHQETAVVAALGDDADELLARLAPWSTAVVAWATQRA
ncbi:MAG: hypothetical protein AMXMBFR46_09090 [Acidimicrobiia bacterium]